MCYLYYFIIFRVFYKLHCTNYNMYIFTFRYTIRDEYSGSIISNYKEHSDGDKFRDALIQSLNQILDILKT